MNSPTIEPISAKPTVSFSPAKISVSEAGTTSLRKIWNFDAPSVRIRLIWSLSTPTAPLYDVTSATMMTDSVDIATFEINPVPNQMMMIGASAMIGIEPNAITNGSTTRVTNLEYQSESPMTVPTTISTNMPSKGSESVSSPSRHRLSSPSLLPRTPAI